MPSARSTIARAACVGQARDEPREQGLHRRPGERFEEHRDEGALGCSPLRAALVQLGPSQGDHVDRDALRPLEEVLDEVDGARVGPVKVLEDHDHGAGRGQAFEVRAPCSEELIGTECRPVAEQRQEGGFDPAPLGLVGHDGGDALADLAPRRCLVVRFRESRSATDHLAEGPEGDALAIRRRTSVVPVDVLGHPVEILLELPGQPALADAGRTDDADEPCASFATGRMEQVLQEAQLLVATDEGSLEGIAPVPPAAFGHDPDRSPGRDRGALALEGLLAEWFVGDRRLGGARCALADQDRARVRHGLESGGGVDEVACDHPLVGGAQRDGGFAGQDAGSGLDGRTERSDRVHQFQRGTDAPFGVILVGDRCPPDGHDRVTDELFDRSAVSPDHVGGDLEVPREHFADLLGVAFLGERREPDEIREQDRHQAALAGRGRWAGSTCNSGGCGAPMRRLRRPGPHRSEASRTRCRTWRSGCWSTRMTGRARPAAPRTPCRTSPRGCSPFRTPGRSSGECTERCSWRAPDGAASDLQPVGRHSPGRQALSFARPHVSPRAQPRPRPMQPKPKVVPMKVGVAKETAPGERRVALVPEVLGKLQAAGLEILVERGAGAGVVHPRRRLRGRRCDGRLDRRPVRDRRRRSCASQKPSADEVARLRSGQAVIGLLAAAHRPGDGQGARRPRA